MTFVGNGGGVNQTLQAQIPDPQAQGWVISIGVWEAVWGIRTYEHALACFL